MSKRRRTHSRPTVGTVQAMWRKLTEKAIGSEHNSAVSRSVEELTISSADIALSIGSRK